MATEAARVSEARVSEISQVADYNPGGEGRFFELDILRGFASYLVVIYHYKHFLFSDLTGFDYARLPFLTLLEPVYVYGQFFVELFFSISGYVFFWLYANALAERKMGVKSFFIARFSRLYPLFFATFIAVALAQWAFHALYGYSYIYHHNTVSNFALNLFMVHQWIPHAEQTFNGPSWSISVEVFLYAVFFVLSYVKLNKPTMVAVVIVLGLVFRHLEADQAYDFARGVPSFFFGGLAYYVVQDVRGLKDKKWLKIVDTTLKWTLPFLWLLTYIRTQPHIWMALTGAGQPPQTLPYVQISHGWDTTEGFVYGLIPLTLVALGLRQDRWRTPLLSRERLHSLSWIGDISYSLYLLHFPLQIGVMILAAHWPYEQRAAILGSPWFFLGFMTLATVLARWSYTYFEMPARKTLKTFLTKRLRLQAKAA